MFREDEVVDLIQTGFDIFNNGKVRPFSLRKSAYC